METIKQILIDSLNGLSADLIPLYVFQLLCAGLFGHLIQKIINKKFGGDVVTYGALISTAIAVLTSIAKYSVSFAVLAAAAILLLGRQKESSNESIISLFLITALGVGCGTGSVIQTGIGFCLLVLIILFIPLKK